MDWTTVAEEVDEYFQRGDLDYCIRHVSDVIRSQPASPFHHVLAVEFTNDPADVARHFDQFVEQTGDKIQLAAIYTETNGFFINPDRWYFYINGFSSYGGHHDYDWLSRPDVIDPDDIPLTGMESLQQVYEQIRKDEVYKPLSYGIDDPQLQQLRLINDLCDLLVVFHFQNLIRHSAALMQNVHVPVLATSHEYDLIYEVRPTGRRP